MIEKKTRALLIEFAIYAILFTLVLGLFPLWQKYEDANLEIPIMRTAYYRDYELRYLFPFLFMVVLVSFLTLNRVFISAINGVVIVLASFLLFIFMSISSMGIPYLTTLLPGFWLQFLLLSILITRALILKERLHEFKFNIKTIAIYLLLTVSMPLGILALNNVPAIMKKRTPPEFLYEEEKLRNDRFVLEKVWDYSKSHDAIVLTYSSVDTLKNEAYRFDSVGFNYYNIHGDRIKRFTRKAVNGKIQINEVLEKYD